MEKANQLRGPSQQIASTDSHDKKIAQTVNTVAAEKTNNLEPNSVDSLVKAVGEKSARKNAEN